MSDSYTDLAIVVDGGRHCIIKSDSFEMNGDGEAVMKGTEFSENLRSEKRLEIIEEPVLEAETFDDLKSEIHNEIFAVSTKSITTWTYLWPAGIALIVMLLIVAIVWFKKKTNRAKPKTNPEKGANSVVDEVATEDQSGRAKKSSFKSSSLHVSSVEDGHERTDFCHSL